MATERHGGLEATLAEYRRKMGDGYVEARIINAYRDTHAVDEPHDCAAAHCPWTLSVVDRDDTATIDPAVIEQTAEALWNVIYGHDPSISWGYESDRVRDRYRRDARAAAGVLVPATAEQTIAEIRDLLHDRSRDLNPDMAPEGWHSAIADVIAWLREFAAGLSASAATHTQEADR